MRKGKKALLLVVLILIPYIAITSRISLAKASPLKMSVDPPAILSTAFVPDTQFSIDIVITYIEKPIAYFFEMTFNPEVLHGVSVEVGPFLGSAGGVILPAPGKGFDNEMGKLWLTGGALQPGDVNAPTGGSEELGPLATVTFEVVGIGRSKLSLGLNSGLLNMTGDPEGNEGRQFDGEWAWGYKWVEYLPGYPVKVPNPGFLGHGYFDNRPAIKVDPERVKGIRINKSFTVNVNVINITDLHSWEFSMNWNATLLNTTAVAEGGFLKGQPEGTRFAPAINNDAGNLTVSCDTIGAHPGVSGGGTLTSVTFLVKNVGKTSLTLYDTLLLNSTGGAIANRTVDGEFTNLKFHDIAIISVTPHPTKVKEGSGDPIFINVTVMNVGDYNETDVNVTAYYEDNKINTTRIPSLDAGENQTVRFLWNTTGVSRGKYALSAKASIETVEKEHTYGLVTISAHDVAIISVTTPVSNVYSGLGARVTVVVKNEGTELENLNVTAYYNETAIDTETISDLGYGATRTLEFTWDTRGIELGSYIISAKATVVEGEKDTADNTFAMEKLINVVPLEAQPFPTELFILVVSAVVIFGAAILLYWRRRRRLEAGEELIRPYSS